MSRAASYRIRCQECGYETDRFNGWAFCGPCRTPGVPGMLHDFKPVPDELDTAKENAMPITDLDVRILIWDCREQPDWEEISRAQADGYVYLIQVPETGSDQYAFVASPRPRTPEIAQQIWDETTADMEEGA